MAAPEGADRPGLTFNAALNCAAALAGSACPFGFSYEKEYRYFSTSHPEYTASQSTLAARWALTCSVSLEKICAENEPGTLIRVTMSRKSDGVTKTRGCSADLVYVPRRAVCCSIVSACARLGLMPTVSSSVLASEDSRGITNRQPRRTALM